MTNKQLISFLDSVILKNRIFEEKDLLISYGRTLTALEYAVEILRANEKEVLKRSKEKREENEK